MNRQTARSLHLLPPPPRPAQAALLGPPLRRSLHPSRSFPFGARSALPRPAPSGARPALPRPAPSPVRATRGGGASPPPRKPSLCFLTVFLMADSAAPHCLGPSDRASSTQRKAAGTKQTRALKPEDASRRRAELEAAVQRKVECERKAVHIVEQLLEENITEEFLKECGTFITPAHYSDVVDERAIIKLCGYPLCQKKLGAIPKQKYKISTKTNKVYDITERKGSSLRKVNNTNRTSLKPTKARIPLRPVNHKEDVEPRAAGWKKQKPAQLLLEWV